jgi:glycosyltransferase involved in cell wall biosynthesis
LQGSVLIDISRLMARTSRGRLPTGVDRVCLSYIAHFGARAQAVLQWGGWRRIVGYEDSQRLFALLQAPATTFYRDAALVIARACVPPWPSQDGGNRVYFNLSHTGVDDDGVVPWLLRHRLRPVFLVHDLIPITHAEYCRAGEQVQHGKRVESMLLSAAGVITNSRSTLRNLEDFARARQLPMPPSVAAPLAPARLRTDAGSAPLPQPYFVVLGTIEPRKNHLLLLHAWRELAARFGAATPHLAVIGQRGWECENVVDMLERCDALRGFVHELPACSDVEMTRYLRHANALLFPSFAEGYGMPLVESLMLRTPVIANRLDVFEEIAGEVPDYVDALDGPGWIHAIEEFRVPGSARRAAQLARMSSFQVPTWERHFERVETLLEQLK